MFRKNKAIMVVALIAVIFFTGRLGKGDYFGIKSAFGYGAGSLDVGGGGGGGFFSGGAGIAWLQNPAVTANGLVGSYVPMTVSAGQDGKLIQNFSGDLQAILQVPAGSVAGSVRFEITGETMGAHNSPLGSYGAALIGGMIFCIDAYNGVSTPVHSFDRNLDIVLTVNGMPYSTVNLGAYYFNETTKQWILVSGARFDPSSRKVNFQIGHLTDFAVFTASGTPAVLNTALTPASAISATSTPSAVTPNTNVTTPVSTGSIDGPGLKIYADGTLLRGSDKKVYLITDQKKYLIRSLTELKRFTGQPIYDVSNSVIAAYPLTDNPGTAPASIANPASVFCTAHGGKLEITSGPDGEKGICKFPNGKECDEWAFFRGECNPNTAGAPAVTTANVSEKGKYTKGMLIRASDKRIFVIENNQKIYIPSLAELGAFRGQKINDVSDAVINSFPDAPVVSEGNLFRKLDMKIYVIKNGILTHVKNLAELAQHAGKRVYNVAGEIFNW